MNYPIEQIRADFPILNQKVHGRQLVYLDNNATTQKPRQVIDKITEIYTTYNSNIHRGVHHLSNLSTEAYENARKEVAKFINAESSSEIVFTKGTSESINLVAFSFGEKFINKGDEILVSHIEHHSNIVPWQLLCERKSAILKVIPVDDNGYLSIDDVAKQITDKTKIISVSQVSNSLGNIQPVEEIIQLAHSKNIPVLVDGAQAVQHFQTDVRKLDADFYCFSGHKMYAPTGIGVLYGKTKWLDELPPYQGGGDMIDQVSFEKTTYNKLPLKFEAGTVNYVGAIALAEAIRYISAIGLEAISRHEHELLQYTRKELARISDIRILGRDTPSAGAVSFLLKGIHHYDAGMILDKMGIAVRTGNHCTQPAMERMGITGTVRASFGLYNKRDEVDLFMEGIDRVQQMFG